MNGKEIIENSKSPFPYIDDWVKKQCKKKISNKKQALITYCYIRESINVMNELRLYSFIPDSTKKDIVKVITTDLINSELLKKAWSMK